MTIFILALHGVTTGGPEATHQLSDALIEQGFDARLVYFTWPDLKDGMPAEFPAYTGWAEEYAHYKAKLARSLPDEDGAVIVLPETVCHLVPHWKRAKVLVWWLSVDNAFLSLGHVNLNYLRAPNVYHASQSRYAETFTQALQLNSIGMLSDYTVDLTQYATPLPMSERPKLVAINARQDKVIADLNALGEEIAKLDPDIRCIAVDGLTRAEVAAVFANSRVYVDLGNFPGKDRLPREATAMGCSNYLAHNGAAGSGGADFMQTHYGVPIAQAIVQLARDLELNECDVRHRRMYVSKERDAFNAEVRDVFSQLTGAPS